MFILSFKLLAIQSHRPPQNQIVNSSAIEWPPTPWRLLSALLANFWKSINHSKWKNEYHSSYINPLVGFLPNQGLWVGCINALWRNYVCVFSRDCKKAMNFILVIESYRQGIIEGLLASLGSDAYLKGKERAFDQTFRQPIRQKPNTLITDDGIARESTSKTGLVNVPLKTRVDALSLPSANAQDYRWTCPPTFPKVPAVFCANEHGEIPGNVHSQTATSIASRQVDAKPNRQKLPTIARFQLAGRPRPRIEDAVKIGELMRRAALSKFDWEIDKFGKRRPMAPWQISGRPGGKPNRDPDHGHAFWIPEDSDGDGYIDHLSVYISAGMDKEIRRALYQINRLWHTKSNNNPEDISDAKVREEWRLTLEGFGTTDEFRQCTRILANSKCWQSVTPFLSSGHLKKAGYPREVMRLLRLRGYNTSDVNITELEQIIVGGLERRPIHFCRFRSRGREHQFDTSGTFLKIEFSKPIFGPLALGFSCHFGLGLFSAADN